VLCLDVNNGEFTKLVIVSWPDAGEPNELLEYIVVASLVASSPSLDLLVDYRFV